MRPKLHAPWPGFGCFSVRAQALAHVALAAKQWGRNARFHHCFTDEDGMMWLKRLLAPSDIYTPLILRCFTTPTTEKPLILPDEDDQDAPPFDESEDPKEPCPQFWRNPAIVQERLQFSPLYFLGIVRGETRINRGSTGRVRKEFVKQLR